VAIGIGFLGSGVIFVSRHEDRVQGLTTAASIWATAAIGIAAGLEHYVLAVGATVLLLFVLRVLVRFDAED
jgi:putative Mg2+ transporter-C (MgtC) family protein